MNPIYRHTTVLTACLLTLCLAACSIDVPLCHDEHPHKAVVDFRYEWPATADSVPETMLVMAVRPINNLAYSFQTTSKSEGNIGTVLQSPDEDYDQHADPITGADSLIMHGGEYEVMAYNGSNIDFDELQKAYEISSVYPIDSVRLKYKPLESVKDYPGGRFHGWNDRNSYSKHLVGLDKIPIYSVKSTLIVPSQSNYHRDVVVCELKPTSISQQVDFQFTCQPKSNDIIVDSIMCEISGVAGNIQISTQFLNTDSTYKVLFYPEITETGNGDNKQLNVKGTVYVPGIVRNKEKGTILGPGILQTAIYIHYEDEEGITIYRRLEASINLFKTLSDSPSVMYDPQKNVLKACDYLLLNIGNVMELTHDKIVPQHAFGGDQWVDETEEMKFDPNDPFN